MLRPFVAWERFDYSDLKYGSLEINVSYENTAVGAKVALKHNQDKLDTLKIVLRAPLGTKQCIVTSAPKGCLLQKGRDYFGRPTWELILKDQLKTSVKVNVQWN